MLLKSEVMKQASVCYSFVKQKKNSQIKSNTYIFQIKRESFKVNKFKV